FVRDRLLDFFNNGRCHHFALRSFKKNNVILHFDSHAAIAAGDHVNAIGEFLRTDGCSRPAASTTARSLASALWCSAAPTATRSASSCLAASLGCGTTTTPAAGTTCGRSSRSRCVRLHIGDA